jgi:hypothetical protein
MKTLRKITENEIRKRARNETGGKREGTNRGME